MIIGKAIFKDVDTLQYFSTETYDLTNPIVTTNIIKKSTGKLILIKLLSENGFYATYKEVEINYNKPLKLTLIKEI